MQSVHAEQKNFPSLRPVEHRLAILAHQGVQGEYPPNSLAGIRQACGTADVLELDVYVAETAAGKQEVVVIHPEGYFLYVDSKGMQNEKPIPASFETLRAVVAKGTPLVPTLNEVLDAYQERVRETQFRTEIHIELKGPGTAGPVLEILKQRMQQGEISYKDFLLTGLCYKNDTTSRIAEARALDPQARLVLVLRGGNLKEEGFNDWADVFATARRLNVEVVTAARKFLTPEAIQNIRDQGFVAGCYHARTSDEIEAAISLGADVVAADYFLSANASDYPHVRTSGSPLFAELSQSGFYILRDWIWELGWDLEKQRESWPRLELATEGTSAETDGAIVVDAQGSVSLKLCTNHGKKSDLVVSASEVTIPEKYLGNSDRKAGVKTFTDLFSQEAVLRNFVTLAEAVGSASLVKRDMPSIQSFATALRMEDLAALSQASISAERLSTLPVLEPKEFALVENLAREYLQRLGRVFGMLGFTAINPRHGEKESYVLSADCSISSLSAIFRVGAEEQYAAQLARSGKSGEIRWKE